MYDPGIAENPSLDAGDAVAFFRRPSGAVRLGRGADAPERQQQRARPLGLSRRGSADPGVSLGLGNPVGGSNVCGYLGLLLALGILPVNVLTNLAAARHFAPVGRFNALRHAVLPIAGAALMIGLLVGQIVEQTGAPYTWFPGVIVGRVAAACAVALWMSAARPDQLKLGGSVMATGAVEEANLAEEFLENPAAVVGG